MQAAGAREQALPALDRGPEQHLQVLQHEDDLRGVELRPRRRQPPRHPDLVVQLACVSCTHACVSPFLQTHAGDNALQGSCNAVLSQITFLCEDASSDARSCR